MKKSVRSLCGSHTSQFLKSLFLPQFTRSRPATSHKVLWMSLSLSDVCLLLLLLLGYVHGGESYGICEYRKRMEPRPHSVSILEFGAVGDGRTLNTVAFQNAIFYLKSFADKGGAQLYVPAGNWLTGGFNLTSHLTLFLEKGAVILATQDFDDWDVTEPLPSYGQEGDLVSWRYRSLIYGENLTDIVITGDNGTIDGQGAVWWERPYVHSTNYSWPHLVEFVSSNDIVVSNLSFLNSPHWAIHPVYCSGVRVENVAAYAPTSSPFTSGIVPDSSEKVCIQNSNISTGHDAIALKSGWDRYGMKYGKPTTDVQILDVRLRSHLGCALAVGSEMSGGISRVHVDRIRIRDSFKGACVKTNTGRGGYVTEILASDIEMEDVGVAIMVTGDYGGHPGDKFDRGALPFVSGITFKNVRGSGISLAGNFSGIHDCPFSSICLSNVTLIVTGTSPSPWACSDVTGFSENVSPFPCSDLQASSSSSSSHGCFSLALVTARGTEFS